MSTKLKFRAALIKCLSGEPALASVKVGHSFEAKHAEMITLSPEVIGDETSIPATNPSRVYYEEYRQEIALYVTGKPRQEQIEARADELLDAIFDVFQRDPYFGIHDKGLISAVIETVDPLFGTTKGEGVAGRIDITIKCKGRIE